jgi:ribosomal protein S18 acetylase RimI-like enzyme
MGEQLPLGYTWRAGERRDRAIVAQWLHLTYQALFPQSPVCDEVTATLDAYWDKTLLLQWVVQQQTRVAGLWVGSAIASGTGERYPYILLLRVEPTHRRRGLGRALMHSAQHWARAQGYLQMGLHVFCHNAAAIALYKSLDYQPHAVLMMKSLWGEGSDQVRF